MEHIKKHQPEKLAQELLNLVDPIKLITYQTDINSAIDINDIEKFTENVNHFYDHSDMCLLFKLGSTIIFSIRTCIGDVYEAIHCTDIVKVKREGRFMLSSNIRIYRQESDGSDYGCITIHPTSDSSPNGEESRIKFVPEIFDQILNDLIKIHDQYEKLLNK